MIFDPFSEIVDYLVSKGCDIHVRSNSGRTAFWKAVQNGHRELVHLLFALGSNVNNKNQETESRN